MATKTKKDISKASDISKTVETSETSEVSISKTLELFHDADGAAYATYKYGDAGFRTSAVKSVEFRSYIMQCCWKASGEVPKKSEVTDMLEQYAAKGMFDGEEHPVFLRSGNHGKNIFIDLCDERGRAVEITKDGWTVVDNSDCKFRRAAGMRPLQMPVSGGSIAELDKFINLKPDDKILFLSLLLAAYRYGKPSPIALVTGEFGSGKTTLSRIFRMLVDPSSIPVATAPNNERDLHIACRNSWVVNIDNQSKLSDAMSDNLCRLATGGGLRTRTLYTDNDEHIFTAIRPVLFNSIEELATRADFLDRTVHLRTVHIAKEKRVPEDKFWKDFEACVPRILGALFDAVSSALKNLPSVRSSSFPRMADFAKWVMAGSQSLGFTAEKFLEVYESNRNAGSVMALDASPIYAPLCSMLEGSADEPYPLGCKGVPVKRGGIFKGSTKQLLQLLVQQGGAGEDFPKNPRALTAQLDRIVPNLRLEGIEVKKLGRDAVRRVQMLSVIKTYSKEETTARAEAAAAEKVKATAAEAGYEANHKRTEKEREAKRVKINEDRTARMDAATLWLREVLKDGPMKAKELWQLGETLGHRKAAVVDAARTIGVNDEVKKHNGKEGRFWWLREPVVLEKVEVKAAVV
jgi:energy-coupling factor transporter ATP-binding protein EcfA2